MALPDTLEGLQNAGYIYQNAATCKGCGAPIGWFLKPEGIGFMPFSRKGTDVNPKRFEPHHAVCPNADQFRKTKK